MGRKKDVQMRKKNTDKGKDIQTKTKTYRERERHAGKDIQIERKVDRKEKE